VDVRLKVPSAKAIDRALSTFVQKRGQGTKRLVIKSHNSIAKLIFFIRYENARRKK